MNREYEYKNKKYQIIESICIKDINFVISKDNHDLLSYMKLTQLESKIVFTPLDKLIKVLDDYNNKTIYNIKKILDYFVRKLNKSIKKGRIKIYDTNKIIIDFNHFIENNDSLVDNEITPNDLKKIDKFISAYESKSLLSKLSNVYGVILLVFIISLGLFSKYLLNQKINSKQLFNEQVEENKTIKTDAVAIDDEKNNQENDDNYLESLMLNVDFNEYLQKNPDTVAWLYVNNTNVDYPIVQGADNEYYLSHSFNKEYNVAGWLFADFRSNLSNLEKNTVIYGHSGAGDILFGTLKNVLDNSWYTNPENQIIKLSTPSKNMLWQIFSIYTIPSESYYLTHTFENDESYSKFLNTLVSRSMYDFNVKVDTKDHILTLSTCLDYNGNRIVVHAKLIKSEKK